MARLPRKATRGRAIPFVQSTPLGLTLIELLVTLLLTSILSVMGFRVLERFVISQEGLVEQARFQRGLALTWAQVESDIQSLAMLSPKQRSESIFINEDHVHIGPANWQVSAEGRLARISAQPSQAVTLMSNIDQIRLGLWVSGEERDFSSVSSLDLQRFARQKIGIVFELRLRGEPYSLRKVFLLPASP
jgi:prepilin-type N-terminal cleavage/methylation domain-containing protein